MVDKNESSVSAAAAAGPQTNRIHVPGLVVHTGEQPELAGAQDAASQAPASDDAGAAGLGELISRERRRHAETRAASEPPTDAAGARVCCVLCFNRNAERTVEDAG